MYHRFPDYSHFVSLLSLPVTVHLWNFCFGLFPVHQHFSQVLLQRGNKICVLDKKAMPQLFDFRVVTDRAAHGNIVIMNFRHEDMCTHVFNMSQILLLITLLHHSDPLSGLISNWYLFSLAIVQSKEHHQTQCELKDGSRRRDPMLQMHPPAVVFTTTGLGGAELVSSETEKGHGGEHLAGDGRGIRTEGKL